MNEKPCKNTISSFISVSYKFGTRPWSLSPVTNEQFATNRLWDCSILEFEVYIQDSFGKQDIGHKTELKGYNTRLWNTDNIEKWRNLCKDQNFCCGHVCSEYEY